eukprot:gene3506-3776_t
MPPKPIVNFGKDLVPRFHELVDDGKSLSETLFQIKQSLRDRLDGAHQSALATTTLRAVKRDKLFPVWDDNVSSQYTGHTGRFRKNLLEAAMAHLGNGPLVAKKVQQVLACYVALYNGPLTEDFLDKYEGYHKDRKQQRTLYIGAYNFVQNLQLQLQQQRDLQDQSQQRCWSFASMPSLAVSLACSKGLSWESDAGYTPAADDGDDAQSAGLVSSAAQAPSALAAIDNKLEAHVGSFVTHHLHKGLYYSSLGKRKLTEEGSTSGPVLYGPGVSAVMFDLLSQEFSEKMNGWCAEDDPELSIFKNADSYWTMLTVEEVDFLSTFDHTGPDPGHKGGLKKVQQLLSGVLKLAAQADVHVLLPYNASNAHYLLGELTVRGHEGRLVMYDSLSKDSCAAYKEHVRSSVSKWNAWLAQYQLHLKVDLQQYVALQQQRCSWRGGFYVVLNAERLMRGKRPLELDSAAAGTLEAAAVDVYCSAIKWYMHTKDELSAVQQQQQAAAQGNQPAAVATEGSQPQCKQEPVDAHAVSAAAAASAAIVKDESFIGTLAQPNAR